MLTNIWHDNKNGNILQLENLVIVFTAWEIVMKELVKKKIVMKEVKWKLIYWEENLQNFFWVHILR